MKSKIKFLVLIVIALIVVTGCGSSAGLALNAKNPQSGACDKDGASSEDRTACLKEENEDLRRTATAAKQKAEGYKDLAAAHRQEIEDQKKPDCDKLADDKQKILCLQEQLTAAKQAPSRAQRTQAPSTTPGPLANNGMAMMAQANIFVPTTVGPSNQIAKEEMFSINNFFESWYADVPAGMQPFAGNRGMFVLMRVQKNGRIENRWMCPPMRNCIIVRQIEVTNTPNGPMIIGQDGPRTLVIDVYQLKAAGLPLTHIGYSTPITVSFPGTSPGFIQSKGLNALSYVPLGY